MWISIIWKGPAGLFPENLMLRFGYLRTLITPQFFPQRPYHMKGQAPRESRHVSCFGRSLLRIQGGRRYFSGHKHHLFLLGSFPGLSTLALSGRPAAVGLMALNQSTDKASEVQFFCVLPVSTFSPTLFYQLCSGLNFWHSH